MTWIRKSSGWDRKHLEGPDPFQQWYRDNQVYFITARCRDGFPAFACERASGVFWVKFENYALVHQFEPWVATLMSNHYHFIGYATNGMAIGEMMRKLHGSVAKLVNDLLPERRVPFWRDEDGHDYFDGCLRDDDQFVRAYRYTLMQAVRARIVEDWREYPNTRVYVSMEEGLKFARGRRAFLYGVPYKRYERKKSKGRVT
jgi:hypothetical protein